MCTYLWNSQHNSWNFFSNKNVHETCHILLSNPRFDGRIFVVRTFNKLPQAKHLLVLEQSLDSASVDQELHDVIAWQVPMHKLHALLAILERLVREKLSLTLPVGVVAFHLSFGGWRVEWFLTLHLSLFFFSRSNLRVFENFAKKDKVPRMVPSIAQVVFVTSPKALREPQLPTLWLLCGDLGRISMRLTCATWCCWAKDRIQEETSYATWSRCASVWNIFVCFSKCTPCFEILLLLLFWRGGHASFFILFDWSTYIFFLCFLSIYSFFPWPLSPFVRLQEEKFVSTLEHLFLVDGLQVLRNSWCRS
jgi:hypothetical protein